MFGFLVVFGTDKMNRSITIKAAFANAILSTHNPLLKRGKSRKSTVEEYTHLLFAVNLYYNNQLAPIGSY